MKRFELFTLLESLDKLDNLTGVKFNYVIDKNRSVIEKEVEDMKKLNEPSKEFADYDKVRLQLLQKFSDKDPQGNPKFTQADGMVKFDIPDKNMKKFQTELDKNTKEFEAAIKERDKQLFEYDKFLQEDAKFTFETLTIEEIDNKINGEQYKIIKHFVAE
jgi:hypothetical protein